MNQISTGLPGFELPPSPAVVAIDKATFQDRSRRFVLDFLRTHGATSSEDLTDAMLTAGITPPGGDSRAFGWIYQKLGADMLAEKYAPSFRRKGHLTLGGYVWKITAKGMQA
jgi:hypothetical protein